jgi:ABC-type transport system involved in multi-copper enzyme maturation permease subunit
MSRILAIARLAFVEGARKRIYLVLLLYVVAVVAGTWALPDVETTGIGEGRIAFIQGFAFQAMFVFAAVSAVFLASVHIPKDISDRTIFTVLTKPVSRLEFVAGKMIGLAAVAAVLVALMGGFAYGYFYVMAGLGDNPRKLAAHRVVEAADVGFYFSATGTPVEMETFPGADFTVVRGGEVRTVFHFRGVDRAGLYTAARWAADDPAARVNAAGLDVREEGLAFSEPDAPVLNVEIEARGSFATETALRLVFTNPTTGESAGPVEARVRGFRSFLVAAPRNLIDETGALDVAVSHRAQGVSLSMNRSGIALLRRPGSYLANYLVCLGAAALAMALLVAVSVTFSTFLSGFVAVLAAIVFFSMGYFIDALATAAASYQGFGIDRVDVHSHGDDDAARDARDSRPEPTAVERVADTAGYAVSNFLGGLRVILPDLNSFNYGATLVAERRVPPSRLLASLGTTAAYAAVLFVLSVAVMARREVAL